MGFFCAHIYMGVCKKMVISLGIKLHKAGKNASIRDQKAHVYRVAGMIASIGGKKPHVCRVTILINKWPTIRFGDHGTKEMLRVLGSKV